jgi:uncharacterized membrane protein HdeD (DUF308 family)
MENTTNIRSTQQSSHDNLDAITIKPFWLLVFGTLLIGLGVFALVSVVTATIVSVYFVAISMVMAGAAEIILGLHSRSQRKIVTWVLLGSLYVVAGFFSFFNPLLAEGVLTLLLGASLVGAGLLRLFFSFQMLSDAQWWWMTLSAAITALLGIIALTQWPASSLYILGVFLSVDLIFAGIGWLMIGASAIAANNTALVSSP